MADVDTGDSGGGKHDKGAKQKKKSTRIDMTAMVDVAFLLLTFFILTTTMATPQAMKATMPPKNDENPEDNTKEVKQSKILTLVLGADDQVHWFAGLPEESSIKSVDYSAEGVRKVIMDHLNKRPDRCPNGATAEEIASSGCWDPIIVIKPAKTSTYKNLVDILDEMSIVNVRKFALGDVLAADSTALVDQGKR